MNEQNDRRHLAPPELTWRVATVIHERCCAPRGCPGAYLHLSEAAAAVDVLLRPPRGPRLSTIGRSAGRTDGLDRPGQPPRAA